MSKIKELEEIIQNFLGTRATVRELVKYEKIKILYLNGVTTETNVFKDL